MSNVHVLGSRGAANLRGCVVGAPGAAGVNKPWFKFADIEESGVYVDDDISFYVTSPYGFYSRFVGILIAHIRTGPTGAFASGEMRWVVAGQNVDPDNFCIAYSSDDHKYELWMNLGPLDTANCAYRFVVLSEGRRRTVEFGLWTLYNMVGPYGETEPTPGYTRLTSTLLPLKNPIVSATADPPMVDGPSMEENMDTYQEEGREEVNDVKKVL